MSESFKVCFCCSRNFKEKTRQPPVSIKRLFEAYSRNGKMSSEELLRFVNEVQGERHAGLDYVQDIFHSVKHHNVFHHHGFVHLNAFYRYLFSDPNSPLPLPGLVHHDMKAPLAHYFVYTGHNSYLTGNQVNSRSSVEPIVQALRKGVKVIELDLWPNPSGNAAEVRHGGTLTSHEDLQKCLSAIKDNAFHVSDYPVMITLEDHLPPKLQGQVAKMLTKTFREMLFRCGSESRKHFPSPEELRKKILISTKPPKEYLESQTVQPRRTTPMVKETSWSRPASSNNMAWRGENKILEELESEAVGYRDLIAIHAANCKNPLKDCLSDDPEKPLRISMDEQWLETMVRTRGTDVVRFTQRNLVRIYPKGTRVDSSNYDPLVGWTHGAQLVAFNMQGHGKQLWIMQGMFRANGGCGYVKKPRILLEHTLFDPCKRFPIKTTLKVKIYTGEGWDLDFPQTHFDQFSPPDFFVKIGIEGVPRDTVSYRTETAVDQWFPIWSNDEFLFQLSVPELALLWFKVQDYDNDTQNDFAGQTCLPLPELKSGVRAVRLHDRAGRAYKNTRLLVGFAFDPPYMFR
ncbi:PREDICTED: phosphoinositide phospholipase C 3 isoform X1 [Camelina sativa]|uniref:Phosphoinositide phospholipase C n=1 Tax=Camelina sativa TaxID=90675 RepID=A0ABM0TUT0_CAMSA|nr:PREDICTED: phosphoinositide phospholipase C 3 isoform X1 [Camelina sativa]XP_010431794.1 PREDICTED: phosphoinositide phospholipase C 3 isoform X1 [Camelina sativa]XP_010431795.1 PREDICTED: phosphoinositide phospholipase C 3 isoform X1 [Camelina sativa]